MNRKWIVIASLLSLTFAATPCFAEKEPWYWTFSLGWGFPIYPDAVDSEIDTLDSLGASNIPIAVDLGFYWPLANEMTIIGPSIHGLSDSYSVSSVDASIVHTGLYFSAIHTFGEEPGSGIFGRADVGIARIGVRSDSSFDSTSDVGFGFLIGGGYGLAVSDTTRLLFAVNFSHRIVEGDGYSVFDISFGPMF